MATIDTNNCCLESIIMLLMSHLMIYRPYRVSFDGDYRHQHALSGVYNDVADVNLMIYRPYRVSFDGDYRHQHALSGVYNDVADVTPDDIQTIQGKF